MSLGCDIYLPDSAVKFSILINNYNNGPYLEECMESALGQSYAPFEVLVVDDGSTDDSLAILQKRYAAHPRVRIIAQSNQGQVAAIAAAVNAARGEVFCFLDADDRFKPHYLERLQACLAANPRVDFVFCRREYFGTNTGNMTDDVAFQSHPYTSDYDHGYSALLVYFGSVHWIGNATSTLTLKARLARSLDLDYVVRHVALSPMHGDNPLVVGSSLQGGRKFFLNDYLVDYRCHFTNHWHETGVRTDVRKFSESINRSVIFNHYRHKSCISAGMRHLLALELKTVPNPMPEHVRIYERLLCADG